jgi:hypothetical protein
VGRAEMRWEKMLTCGSYRQNGVTVLGEVDNSGSRVKKTFDDGTQELFKISVIRRGGGTFIMISRKKPQINGK